MSGIPSEIGRAPAAVGAWGGLAGRLADYATLTKARLSVLVLAATLAGFLLGADGPVDLKLLASTLLGTALVAFGASALNQVWERDLDARMNRTADRPIPAGRMSADEGLYFGTACGAAGTVYLLLTTNPPAAAIAAITLLLYVFVYTPLKTRSTICLPVGAVPGALPPLIGFAAAHGSITYEAWLPVLLVYFWQHPHFLAIAWLYREDYARGGFAIDAVHDADGARTGRQAVGKSIALAVVSLLPTAVGAAGAASGVAALLLSLALLGLAIAMSVQRTKAAARRLFIGSIVYLPLVLAFQVLDRTGG